MTIRFFSALLALPLLLSCSKQDSEKVEINFVPESPKVKFAKGAVQTGTSTYQEISPPWFKFNFTVQNGSDKNVIIESLLLKLTGLSATDGTVTVEKTLTVASIIGGTTNDIVLEEVTAGQTSEATVDLHVQQLSSIVTSGVYTVEVEARGWFGTINEPVSVFSQKYFFTTQ